jgi:hypothetical protein
MEDCEISLILPEDALIIARKVMPLEHDPEEWEPVLPRDKRQRRLRGDHAQIRRWTTNMIQPS